MKIKRLPANTIVVKYTLGRFQGRVQNNLFFANEYVEALRSALNAVRSGATVVSVSQYREVVHSHSELYAASRHLGRNATDQEVIEEVNYFTHLPSNPNLIRLLDSVGSQLSTIWAVAS